MPHPSRLAVLPLAAGLLIGLAPLRALAQNSSAEPATSPPALMSVDPALQANASGDGPTCSASVPSGPSLAELMTRVRAAIAAQGDPGEDVIVLNGRGYNYRSSSAGVSSQALRLEQKLSE